MTLDVKKSNSSNETPNVMTVGVEKYGLMPSSSALIPMSIRTLQCLFSHLFTTYEWLNRDCDVQIDIGIWADELGISLVAVAKLKDFETHFRRINW
jgi:hypothetical protein